MMSTKLHKAAVSTIVAGLVALMSAPAAEANRGGGEYTPPTTAPDIDDIVDVVDVDVLGEVEGAGGPGAGNNDPTPQADGSGGDPLGAAPDITPADAASTNPVNVMADGESRPEVKASPMAGLLSKTGSEAMPLVRAGLAAMTLGAGLIIFGRRRRAAATLA